MKILYIGNERRSAELAATALRNIAPKLAIAWTPHLSVAMRWVHDNRDLAALVVEAEVQNQECTSFVSQVRSRGLTAPVIVVALEKVGAPLAALKAGADDYVADQSLLADLPDIVSRAVRRAQERQALETELVSARDQSERVQREYAAARKDWEEAREHLHAAAAAEAANRERLDRQVRDALASASETERRFNTAAEFLREGKTLFRAMVDQERANRDTLAQNLVDAQAALQNAERRHASEMTTAAAQRAERQAEYDAELAQTAAARDTLAQQLREAEGALERAQQDSAAVAAAAAERLTRREADLATTLAEAAATRHTLELQLADAKTALQHAEQRASVEQLAAAEAFQRQGEAELRLAQEAANRETLAKSLADAQAGLQNAERRHASEMTTAAAQRAERQAKYDAELAQTAATRDTLAQQLREAEGALERAQQDSAAVAAAAAEQLTRREAELAITLAEATATRHTLELQLADAENALQHAEQRASVEQLAAAQASQRQGEVEVRLAQEVANRKNLERASSEHAAERAKLETLVTERDTQLKEQAARHSASQEAAKNALTQIEDGLRLAMEARTSRDRREIEQLQEALKARTQELEATRRDCEVLRTADRVPQLQSQLDDSRAENRRQFERAPYGICRCDRDGALRHVNHALIALLGYRTSDELRTVDFATTVFGSADDLRLLIERCLSKRTTASVETTWRRKDNGLLVVRLLALPAASELIEIVVEDITNLRALEGQLRQAQRMEAVARLASEVAGTCDNLLRDISQDAQQWLATIDRDSAFRDQGELLLHEVTRAAGFLRQLSVYGKKQMSALEPIDVNRVLRDLEPVLKRIAGDDIELVLPKTSSPVNVGVEAERVERLLVNVASYGRQRMPLGGRLAIQLATVVVSRKFVAKYPNVCPGEHVLITVTEARGGLRSDSPIGPRTEPAGANSMRSVSDRPGVDLGVLQGLIRDCGGHLWMKADPTGDMVLKMRLPQRVLARPAEPPTAGPRSDSGRSMARWFRH